MNSEIKNVKLKFNCPADWNNMNPTTGGRHCNSCNKTVYNFTDSKPYEFLQILAENNQKICGRFKSEQMGPQPIYLSFWRKWASAALVLIGINALTNKAYSQGIPAPRKAITMNSGDGIFNGFVVVPTAEFPGGNDAFTKFLATNIKYKKGTLQEKVIATFQIKKDGTLSDIKIMRGKDPSNIKEVLRVLRLSPKWKPSKLNGKYVESEFTVPINFSH